MFSLRKLGAFGRTYRHLQRYNRILQVLLKYGFSDLIGRLHIDQYLESSWQRLGGALPEATLARLSRPERLRLAFEELGPTFIKLGQLLSSRPDLLPPAYIQELARLQDKIPPVPWAEIDAVFMRECGAPAETLFPEFEHEAMAAASIGQVHRARLADGSRVVVKVRRPGIARLINVDLEIFSHIASLMEQYLEELRGHSPTTVVEEFAESLNRELDFTLELANVQRFAQQFKGNPDIHVPEVYPELSSSCILVMEYIEGIKSSDVARLEAEGYDLELLARRGANLVMEQIFSHGFFHADPHPGNIFILPGNVVCFIDFGQMGRLSRRDQDDFTALVTSLVKRDEHEIAGGVLRTTIQLGEVDRDRLECDLVFFMDRYLYQPLEKLEAARIFQDLLTLVNRHHLSFKPSLYLMIKALCTLEGVGMMLDPHLRLFALAQPFMQRLQLERMKPGRLMEEAASLGLSYFRLLRALPDDLRSVLVQLQSGQLNIGFEHRGIMPLQVTLERITNRLVFAIVLAALIVGSSLIVLSGIPPRWHNVPVIGLFGFVLAACMGFCLLIAILKHKKM